MTIAEFNRIRRSSVKTHLALITVGQSVLTTSGWTTVETETSTRIDGKVVRTITTVDGQVIVGRTIDLVATR